MELAPDRPNVELRRGDEGAQIVVLGFPYDAHIVNVVRGIPGRRFDWEAREWWAPVDDWVGVHVAEVLERFPDLTASAEVDAWLGADPAAVGRPCVDDALRRPRLVGARDARRDAAGGAARPASSSATGCCLRRLTAAGAAALRAGGQRAPRCRREPLRRGAAERLRAAARAAYRGANVRRRAAAARRAVGSRDRRGVRQAAGRRGSRTHAAGRPLGRRSAGRVHREARRRGRRAGDVHARAAARRARRGAGVDPRVARHVAASRFPRSRPFSAASSHRFSGRACATRSTPGGRSSPTSRGSARPSRRWRLWKPTARTRRSSYARPR